MICWLTEQAINSEQVLALVLNTMFNKPFGFFSVINCLVWSGNTQGPDFIVILYTVIIHISTEWIIAVFCKWWDTKLPYFCLAI